MYEDVKYMGKPLTEWQALFNNAFTLGELYQMALRKEDFTTISRQSEQTHESRV